MDQNGGIGISSPHSSPRNINLNNYLHRSQGVQVRDCSTWINRNKKGHIEEDRKQRFTAASPPSAPRPGLQVHRETYSGCEGSEVSARQPPRTPEPAHPSTRPSALAKGGSGTQTLGSPRVCRLSQPQAAGSPECLIDPRPQVTSTAGSHEPRPSAHPGASHLHYPQKALEPQAAYRTSGSQQTFANTGPQAPPLVT